MCEPTSSDFVWCFVKCSILHAQCVTPYIPLQVWCAILSNLLLIDAVGVGGEVIEIHKPLRVVDGEAVCLYLRCFASHVVDAKRITN